MTLTKKDIEALKNFAKWIQNFNTGSYDCCKGCFDDSCEDCEAYKNYDSDDEENYDDEEGYDDEENYFEDLVESMRSDILRDEKEEAVKFVNDFTKKEKYIAIRIRDGYIGKPLDKSGKRLQLERKPPRGTLVAIKGKNGKVYIGSTYLKKGEKDVPIIGIANALKDALKNRKTEGRLLTIKNKNDFDLASFFLARASAYFFPEIYSHSRGKAPVEYPNYKEVHKNRERALKFLK